MNTATNLAYKNYRGTKIVTMCGKMIDEFGLVTVK